MKTETKVCMYYIVHMKHFCLGTQVEVNAFKEVVSVKGTHEGYVVN